MERKHIALSLLAVTGVVFLVMFGSCSARRSSGPVTIRWWHINSDQATRQVLAGVAGDFKKMRPNVDVKMVALENMEYKPKLELEFAANDPPDIFHSWGGGGLAEQAKSGYLRDITDWVKSDRWHSRINPVALSLFTFDGKIYGFPQDLGAVGFWYNSELLAKAGYRSFPTDWDDFIAMLGKLKSIGITPVALGIEDRWPVMYYWVYLSMRIGGPDVFTDILEGRKRFTDPALVKAGAMIHSFFLGGYFPSTCIGDDFYSQSRSMGDGTCAVQLMGQWALAVEAQLSEKKDALTPLMRFAPFPNVRGGSGSIGDAMGGGNGFVIGRNAPDEAIELLEFFTRAENLQKYFDAFSGIPTVGAVSIKSEGLGMVKDYLGTIKHFCLYPDQMFPQEIGNSINDISARIMLGEMTPLEGCEALDKAWSAYKSR